MRTLFTSESVTEGHPDKLCDQVSDAILDAILEQDPMARVACETFATTGVVQVMGEITTTAWVDIPAIVRKTVLDIGYDSHDVCFDGASCGVLTAIHSQSPDIAMGVDDALETRGRDEDDIGAGDQGMMFGYACDETPEMMPMPIALAQRLARRLAAVRKDGTLPWLRPDGKTQVTVAYEDGRPVAVDTVVISAQHDPDVPQEEIARAITDEVIRPVIPAPLLSGDTRILVNPTGRFVIGGPAGDTGLTGRKIIVDTYGGYARHGGGAFSGKDPTKVDRSAAYAARHAAKNLVAAGLARSAWQSRSACGWTPRAPARSATNGWRRSSPTCSTCARRRSSGGSACAGRSTGRRRPTVISAVPISTFPGNSWTPWKRCGPRRADSRSSTDRRKPRRT